MENILYLFLGWFLGLFGPKIIEHIQRPYRIKEIKNAIFAELNEVKLRMALTVKTLSPQYSPLDKEMLTWLLPHVEEHDRLYSGENMSEHLRKLAETDENELKKMASAIIKSDPEPGYRLNPFLLPFSESQINSLSMFDFDFQKDLIKLKVKISLLNENIMTSRFYYDKTFENLTGHNPAIIKNNLKDSYKIIARMFKKNVDEIDNFISKYKK